jgi:hypothetical protein
VLPPYEIVKRAERPRTFWVATAIAGLAALFCLVGTLHLFLE